MRIGRPRAGPALLAVWGLAASAWARHARPRFEPTDLDLEDPGTAEFDTQMGVVHAEGDAGNRLVLPDFELDLGLTENVELDLDGAFGVDRFDRPTRQVSGEALWTAVKLGFLDYQGTGNRPHVALGAQIGPRFPTIGATGVGYGGLGLLTVHDSRLAVTLNAGIIVDPGDTITGGQSTSAVSGFDISFPLDAAGKWTGIAEFAGARYFRSDPDEIGLGAGAAYSVGENLDVSLVAICGALPGSDRLGLLLGVTPSTRLW
ncbi:MAG TPA: hypothetical protein VHE30_10510 [Polyangiaceae bacterium]|nr:hypothetical protein [Polyangiaceae bacterium]